MKNQLLALCMIFLVINMVSADWYTADMRSFDDNKAWNYIGVAGGYTTGFGLSYKHWGKKTWGFQVNILPYYQTRDKDKEPSFSTKESAYFADSGSYGSGLLSSGITVLKSISEVGFFKAHFYTAYSALFLYNDNEYYRIVYVEDMQSQTFNCKGRYFRTERDINCTHRVGFGGGFEINLGHRSVSIMGGLQCAANIKTHTYKAGPTIEGGIHMRY